MHRSTEKFKLSFSNYTDIISWVHVVPAAQPYELYGLFEDC